MSVLRASVLACCLALHALPATAQEYDGFGAEEARTFHACPDATAPQGAAMEHVT